MNDSLKNTQSVVRGVTTTNRPLWIGSREADFPTFRFNGILDECNMFNTTLQQADVETLFNNGDGISMQGAPIDLPTITINSPVDNDLTAQNPLEINYTITTDVAFSVFNVTIFVNNTLNKTVNSDANTTIELVQLFQSH